MATISFVIPCYNEAKVLPVSGRLICQKMSLLMSSSAVGDKSFVMFVDDGSKDATWDCILKLKQEFGFVRGVSLSRNCGHQNALLAGLFAVDGICDAAVSLDCDGQDDINAVDEMIREFAEGTDIVYGVRSSRKTDTWFKRFSAELFYKLMSRLGVEIIYNHADYRLISARVLASLHGFREVNLFLRGLFPLIGFNTSVVYYERKERMDGDSHYPLLKMLSFAFDGITSMSIRPIRLINVLGVCVCVCSLLVLALTAIYGAVMVWISIAAVLFVGGMQLIAIGLVGEYVGKTYFEVKSRPRYIVQKRI